MTNSMATKSNCKQFFFFLGSLEDPLGIQLHNRQ